MSAGSFVSSKYESDNGTIYRIRVQPETVAAVIDGTANAAPAGAVDGTVTANARGSKRRFGATARKVTLRFTGALPDGYSGDDISIPILTPALFNAINVAAEPAGTYLGAPVKVIGKSAEQVR